MQLNHTQLICSMAEIYIWCRFKNCLKYSMYSQIPHSQCQIHILDSNQSDTLKNSDSSKWKLFSWISISTFNNFMLDAKTWITSTPVFLHLLYMQFRMFTLLNLHVNKQKNMHSITVESQFQRFQKLSCMKFKIKKQNT